MKHTIIWGDGFLAVKTSGDAGLKGLADMVADILSHPKWEKDGAIFIDHSDLNSDPLTVGEIYSIAGEVGRVRERFGRARVAFLVARDLEFGMLRMWDAIASDKWDGISRSFRSRTEAISWLKSNEVV
jgi:hypothetical protein